MIIGTSLRTVSRQSLTKTQQRHLLIPKEQMDALRTHTQVHEVSCNSSNVNLSMLEQLHRETFIKPPTKRAFVRLVGVLFKLPYRKTLVCSPEFEGVYLKIMTERAYFKEDVQTRNYFAYCEQSHRILIKNRNLQDFAEQNLQLWDVIKVEGSFGYGSVAGVSDHPMLQVTAESISVLHRLKEEVYFPMDPE